MSVHYKAANPLDYALNVADLKNLVKAGSTTSVREIIGQSPVDYLLTEGKASVENEAKNRIQKILDVNGTGFQDLASARQDRAVYINEAMAYQNTIVPEARAEAYKQVAEAEGYREEKIKNAEGDAVMFTEKQAAYALSSDVTEFRLYMEAMDKILPNVQKILLGADVTIDNAELWISNLKNKVSGGAE